MIAITLSLGIFRRLENNNHSRTLKYWHYAPSGGFSLDPKDSDSYLNFVLMYQIVGTLLKNGKDGVYEPYLADSWEVTQAGRKYTFKFRSNLKSSRGKEINAAEYSKVFHFLSKYLSSGDGGLVQFDRIEGMTEYLKGKSNLISGVTVDETNNLISFLFMEPPDDVLIAFTEPYFGFYNLEDLTNQGLSNPLDIDCSGGFKITEVSKDLRSVIISRRTEFPVSNKFLYKNIHLQLFKEFDFLSENGDQLIYGSPDILPEWQTKYNFTNSDPNMLGALVLSPFLRPFDQKKNREYLRDRIQEFKNKFNLVSPRGQNTKYFNFLSHPQKEIINVQKKNNLPLFNEQIMNESIDVAYFNLLSSEKNWITQVFDNSTSSLGFKLRLKQIDRSVPGELNKVVSDKIYPARFVTVVVGGTASNQNNKMMFCSQLGVNFKDPSGQICALIHEYEQKSGVIDQAYIDRFNEILWDDSVVIPMFHLGFYWMHDSSVNPQVLRFGLGMPRFDLIEFYE